MGWLIAYAIGLVLMLIICGAASGKKADAGDLFASIFISTIWPLALPWIVGQWIREMSR